MGSEMCIRDRSYDPSFAMDNVTPMIPGLLLIVPPILGAIGLRLLLYVGLHSIIGVATSYIHDSTDGKPRYLLTPICCAV